ncbi:MAG: hypothetical protein AB8G15_18565 [Saprospiraceae bacterium]
MAFPKKKSRKIIVANQSYRWMTNDDGPSVTLSISPAQDHGSKLFAYFNYNLDLPPSERFQQAITPFLTRRVILYALTQGYTPTKRGKDMRLGDLSGKISEELTGPKMTTRLLQILSKRLSANPPDLEMTDDVKGIITDTQSLLNHGEWFIGFENLLSNLDEIDFKLTAQEIELLKAIGAKGNSNWRKDFPWIENLQMGQQAPKS